MHSPRANQQPANPQAVNQPRAGQPPANRSLASHPSTNQPSTNQPSANQPSTNQPRLNRGSSSQRSTHDRMLTQAEQLIRVDSANVVLGQVGKIEAHAGRGCLHRAFTAFLFDTQGRTLLTKRSPNKPLWPGYWDGACSSHQWYPDETAVGAAARRIPFELGLEASQVTALTEHFMTEYHAVYSSAWSENELNSIVTGRSTGECQPNAAEVAAHEWLRVADVTKRLAQHSELFAPWFAYAWEGLQKRRLLPSR